MSDYDYKPVNPFVKKAHKAPEKAPAKTRQVLTFKSPFQSLEEQKKPSDGIKTKDIMHGKFELRQESPADIPEFDNEVEDILEKQHRREGEAQGKTAGGKKNPFARPAKAENGRSAQESGPVMPQFGREILSNPMAQVGIEYTKK